MVDTIGPFQGHIGRQIQAFRHGGDRKALIDGPSSQPNSFAHRALADAPHAIEELPNALTSPGAPMDNLSLRPDLLNAAAGVLSRNDRAAALATGSSQPDIQLLLQQPPYADGMETHAPRPGSA